MNAPLRVAAKPRWNPIMFRFALFVVAACIVGFASAQPPQDEPVKIADAAKAKPWFIDDEKFFEDFMEKLTELAKDGKPLATAELAEKMKPGKKARVTLAKP